MVAAGNHKHLIERIFPIVVGVTAVVVAAVVATLPMAVPGGAAGRVLLALVAGGLVVALALLPMLLRRRSRPAPVGDAPVVRRADAHPDAPPRRPISAAEDLGPPLVFAAVPAPVATRPLPADLDLPLAAFDPSAIPDAPRPPLRAVAPLASLEGVRSVLPPPLPRSARPSLIDPGERFETFELTPPTRAATEPGNPASIAALLDRLERGATRRVAPPHHPTSLDETLGMLRRLAAG